MQQETYPELKTRIGSSIIDAVLLVVMMFVFASMLDKYGEVPDWVRISMFLSLFLVYEPLCMTIGCTLGNYINGIRVRKNSDSSKRINILQALVRYPVKVILGWISFLTISSNSKRRAIHDMVSGTVMINIRQI